MTSVSEGRSGADSVLESNKSSSFMNQLPKYGILIPNRIFVGSISGNTTEAELKQFFSTYGTIKDCKIILDKAGMSKGFGFVTFESAEDASKLLKQEGEHLFYKDRKLNIGPAVRKQQTTVPVLETGAAGGVIYTNGAPVTFPNVVPLVPGPESLGMSGLPQMASTPYPLVFGPHQQLLIPPNYYPSAGLAAPALQWTAMVGSSHHLPWTTQQATGLQLAPNGHLPVPSTSTSAQLALPSAGHGHYGHYLYQYPSLPPATLLPTQEMIYPPATSVQYSEGGVNDNLSSLEASSSQGNNILMDPLGVSGQVQYFEVSSYAAAAAATGMVPGVAAASVAETLSLAPTSKSSNSSNIEKPQIQNYGIKRVLAVPHQVVCASSNPYGFYGVPPVKIIAGQGGQRIVAKSIGTTEIQILPKPQT